WHLDYLKMDEAHRITEGAGVKVAVIDTGTSAHTDLKRNLLKGTDVIPDGNGTGRVDTSGHGTLIAGLIAGHGHGSGAGALGMAPAAKVVPVKAFEGPADNGDSLVAAIEWATKAGVGVMNISGATVPSRPLLAAAGEAVRSDVVVVASSGNRSDGFLVAYPAAIPEVLAVGAVDKKGKLADFSVTGSAVDICAPGADIVGPYKNNKYYKGNGTSESAAVASGAVALVRAKFPELSAEEVVHRITATADDIGPSGKDDQCGYGVLNVVKALTAEVGPLTSATPAATSAAPSAVTPVTADVPTAPVAAAEPKSSSSTALVAGAGIGAVGLAGLLAFVMIRKRRAS
ncbi:MAG TPA: S8 family serine peptidase, partial [Actinoplanes sp.]|nr:S8 family serine peptidase [Actinoplanes sp.]